MDIRISEQYVRRAMELHQEYPAVDAHLDLAGEILLRNQAGERDIVKRYYLPHFQTAGISLIISSVYVENGNLERGWENALEQIDALREDVKDLEEISLIKSKEDLEQSLAEKRIGILLYMEGLDCIGEDLEKIKELYRLGVMGASLTWSRPNALAVGCCKALEHRQITGGLKEAGKEAIRILEEKSMFLDVSHLNDEGFLDVCRTAQRSFIATHSGSRHVYDSFRNLTDEQMRALAGQGGIMGMNGCKYIAGSLGGNHLEMLCRHIEYEAEKIGPEHVGFGFDLCDSYDRARAALNGRCCTDRDDCLLHHGQ
ncbi:MAG: membrane dipeptidase, partial [Lachnospiraceae bacterium]|nr:membrane dipeptidase [Lachnospiraceae bacterium]